VHGFFSFFGSVAIQMTSSQIKCAHTLTNYLLHTNDTKHGCPLLKWAKKWYMWNTYCLQKPQPTKNAIKKSTWMDIRYR